MTPLTTAADIEAAILDRLEQGGLVFHPLPDGTAPAALMVSVIADVMHEAIRDILEEVMTSGQ